MPAADGTVMLGYVHGGTVRAEFMGSVLNVVAGAAASPLIGGVCDATAGPLVAMARNMLCEQFLAGTLEWLLTVDTDIVFTPAALTRLAAAADPQACPVVSGLYYVAGQGDQVPAMYRAGQDAAGDLSFANCMEWAGDDLLRVDGCGAGFLLIHRAVLERIAAEHDGAPCWFREATVGHRQIGEDLSFCIRVAGAGYPLHVHTGVQAGHIKAGMLGKPS